MRLLPVIDLLRGQVVRGMGGRREEYRPIVSRIVDSAEPAAVGRALVERFGFRDVYVADLDAIAGAEPDWETYRRLAACGLRLWIDAGVESLARAQSLAAFEAEGKRLDSIVVGLESLADPVKLPSLIHEMIGPQRLVFSLDLKHGVPLVRGDLWGTADPEAIVSRVVDAGVGRLIVLDLAQVGSDGGPSTLDLCRRTRAVHPLLEIVTGGGIRGPRDLSLVRAAGADAVLVASALHDGRIGSADLDGVSERRGLSPPRLWSATKRWRA